MLRKRIPEDIMIEDVPPRQVWEALMSNPTAVLCDCRTNAEWNFVGLPELSQTGKQPVLIQWQSFPTMQPNPNFLDGGSYLFHLPFRRPLHGRRPGRQGGGVQARI
jgi:hypothetical protein